MKTPALLFTVLGLLILAPSNANSAGAKERERMPRQGPAPAPDPAPGPQASIHVKGKPNATQRMALAKIDFQTALNAAVAAVSGKACYGELEVDDGDLVYSFQIITPAHKVMDVAIDAGNGKVLSVDEGDDE